ESDEIHFRLDRCELQRRGRRGDSHSFGEGGRSSACFNAQRGIFATDLGFDRGYARRQFGDSRGTIEAAGDEVSSAFRRYRSEIERQVKSERAAFFDLAFYPNGSAKHLGNLSAERQTEPGAAIFAGSSGVGLLESFEDNPLLVLGDSRAGIAYLESENRFGFVE